MQDDVFVPYTHLLEVLLEVSRASYPIFCSASGVTLQKLACPRIIWKAFGGIESQYCMEKQDMYRQILLLEALWTTGL